MKNLCEKRGLTQKEVADRLDVHENSIGGYENNTRTPRIGNLLRLAVIYNSSVDYILGVNDRSNLYIDDLPTNKQELIIEIVDKIRADYETERKK